MRRSSLKIVALLITALFVITGLAYAKDYANPQLLVTPADIEKNKDKWIVIDCRDKADKEDKKPKRS